MIDALLKPIDDRSPAGQDCADSDKFDQLETIMSQYGGLRQGNINWDDVEGLSSLILKHEGKHFKVLLFYITSLLMGYTHDRFADSLLLLAGFIDNYLDTGFPAGKQGDVRRRRLVEQILGRLHQQGKKQLVIADETGSSTVHTINAILIDRIEEALTELNLQLSVNQIDNPLQPMQAQLDLLRRAIAQPKAPRPTTASTSISPSNKTGGNDKQFKSYLLEMADHCIDQQPHSPLGYMLRRHIKWQGIQSAPPVKTSSANQTEMSAPNADHVNEYREQLQARQFSPDLLHQIEQTVMNATFWLSGSVYAAQVALGLGYSLVAGGIVLALEQFLARIPQLAECTFNDGTPFLDKDDWQTLRTMVAAGADDGSPMSTPTAAAPLEWQAVREDIQLVLDTSGIGAALETLEDYRQQAASPREAYYLKLFACESLQQAGVLGLSRDMLQAASEKVKQLPVSEWEPGYFQCIDSLLDNTEDNKQRQS